MRSTSRPLPRPGVFAFNCRPFVIIATDSRPPCCISRFLPRRAPSLLHPPFVPPPLSDPSILHTLLPLLLAISFSLFLSPVYPTFLPTLYLSLPFFRRDNVSLAIARPRLPSLADEHADSLASEYLRVHRECSPRSPVIVVLLQSRGSLRPARSADLFQTQRSSHRHASSLSFPPGHQRDEKERGKGVKERDLRVHVSTDTRPKSPRWKSLPSSSHSRARVTWPLQWRN